MPVPIFADARATPNSLSHTNWLQDKLACAASEPRPRVSHQQVMDEAQALINRKWQDHVEGCTT